MSMSLNPLYPYPKEIILSHSSLNMGCDRKFELYKFYQAGFKYRNFPAEIGNAMHEGFGEYIRTKDVDTGLIAMFNKYPWDLQHTDYNKSRDEYACFATFMKLVQFRDLLEYDTVDIKCLDGETRVGIEVPFEIIIEGFEIHNPLTGELIPIKYIGFMDLVLFNTFKKLYRVLDLKTTRDNVKDATLKYLFHEQVTPYSLVLESMLNKVVEQLNVTYLHTYIDVEKPTIKKYEFTRTRTDIEDWIRGIIIKLNQIKLGLELQWFKRNENNCLAFKKQCGYKDCCYSRDPKFLKNYFSMGEDEKLVRDEFVPWMRLTIDVRSGERVG